MALSVVPRDVQTRYQIEERRHACAILAADFPTEFADLIECLRQFELVRSEVTAPGEGKTKIAARFDRFLADPKRGWAPKRTAIAMTVNGVTKKMDTHEVVEFLDDRRPAGTLGRQLLGS
jgi:Restriction endonuclease BglII